MVSFSRKKNRIQTRLRPTPSAFHHSPLEVNLEEDAHLFQGETVCADVRRRGKQLHRMILSETRFSREIWSNSPRFQASGVLRPG